VPWVIDSVFGDEYWQEASYPPVSATEGDRVTRTTTLSKRRMAAMIRQRDEAILCLQQLNPERLARLLARGEQSAQPDGYPPTSLPGSRGGGAESLTSVEAAAEARIAGGRPDPVLDAISWVGWTMAEVYDLCRHAVERVQDVEGDSERAMGRQAASSACPACPDGLQALRGLCRTCYGVWTDHGRPDFAAFVAWRQGKREECPPATAKARRGPWARVAALVIPDGTVVVRYSDGVTVGDG
jgi:hypothetical protein